MSIKSELASLRKRQEEVDKLIKDFAAQLANGESQQKSISNNVEQFAKRKSELAVKLYQEHKTKLEFQTQKVNKLRLTLEQYEEEYSSNEEKIKSYLEDTSFYINEQVPYLIEEFLKYVEKNEIELGTSITSNFEIDAYRVHHCCCLRDIYIDDGNFVVKKIITDKEPEVIVKTKNYYFEKEIAYLYSDYEDWYISYAENFKNSFIDALAKKFTSKSFKLAINGYSFTLDLI